MAQQQRRNSRQKYQRGSNVKSRFELPLIQDHVSWQLTLVFILLAMATATTIRLIWVHDAWNNASNWWNGSLITNNQDTVYFACIVQKAASGMHQQNDQVQSVVRNGMITVLPYLLVKFLSLTIESLLIYLSPLVAGLICIPVVLIGRLYGCTTWGFFAALLVAVAHSYFNRTIAGYYDTDVFVITVLTVALFFLLKATRQESFAALAAASFTLFVYPFFYHPGLVVGFALAGAFIAYRWILYPRSAFTQTATLLISLAAAFSTLSRGPMIESYPWAWFLALACLIAAVVVLQKTVLRGKALAYLCGVVAAGFFILAIAIGFKPVSRMLFPREPATANNNQRVAASTPSASPQSGSTAAVPKIQFREIYTSVREMRAIPWDYLAQRISGSIPSTILAMLGYVVLCWKFREFLFAVPLVALGIAARMLGLRFTIYAIPVAVLSVTLLPLIVTGFFTKNRAINIGVAALCTTLLVVPNIRHALIYTPTVVHSRETIQALDELGKQSSPEDFVITWWDYGSSIWYFAGCQTLDSPASNGSRDNYLLSRILTSPSQLEVANLSREAVENYVARGSYPSAVQHMLREGQKDQRDPQKLFAEIASKQHIPSPKTRDVYLYFPNEILKILAVVHSFSNRDLLTGEEYPAPAYFPILPSRRTANRIVTIPFQRGFFALDLRRGVAQARGRTGLNPKAIKAYHEVAFSDGEPPRVRTTTFNPEGKFHFVYVEDLGEHFLMDERMFNSAAVQMHLFGKYDPELFELVARTPGGVVYRVKK